MKFRILVSAYATTFFANIYAATEGTPVGFIQKIAGNVFICNGASCDSDSVHKLKQSKDTGRILFDDQQLKCNGGSVLIHTSQTNSNQDFSRDFCGKTGRTDWIRMPSPTTPDRIASTQDFATVLRLYGRRAGRDRGGDESPIYSPPAKGAVIAGKLAVRWRTEPPLSNVAIVLLDEQGNELARANDVDGKPGVLESDNFRKALTTYRDKADENRGARIVFKPDARVESTVDFSVLSHAQEESLEKALSKVDSSHGLFGYVERASIYEAAKMDDLAAAEFDAALREAPSSRDMLQASFNAHSRIGDLARAHELRKKLEEIEASGGN